MTTFFTMAYIVIVNPQILGAEGTGMPASGVLTATVLLCFGMTLIMGLYAKLPFAGAPGMGINAFFAYTLVIGRGVPWETALGAVFWAGVIFLLASILPIREWIVKSIPLSLRSAAAGGIAVFILFIGLKNGGVIQGHPVTLVQFAGLTFESLMTLLGTAVVLILMVRFRNPMASLIGIAVVTAIAFASGRIAAPSTAVSLPDFESVFLKLDIMGALQLAIIPSIVSILFTDLFDSISTFVGVSEATGLVDEEGNPKNLRQGLIVDALGTLGAAVLGTSSGTTYIESAAGIEAGGRTGLTAVVAALCFLPCLFFGPLVELVPPYATAPVLVVVGILMFRPVLKLKLSALEELVPVVLTIVLIPLTFSITQGILWGFIAHTGMFVLVGRHREVPITMYVLSLLSAGLLVLEASAS